MNLNICHLSRSVSAWCLFNQLAISMNLNNVLLYSCAGILLKFVWCNFQGRLCHPRHYGMIVPILVTVLCHPRHYGSFVSVILKLSIICAQDLRRKLPVTRTLFPWHNTLALSLTRDLAKELALGKWSLQAMSPDGFEWNFYIHGMLCCSVVISILHCLTSELPNPSVNQEHTFVENGIQKIYILFTYPPAAPDVKFCLP
jgi:hypothetical protein